MRHGEGVRRRQRVSKGRGGTLGVPRMAWRGPWRGRWSVALWVEAMALRAGDQGPESRTWFCAAAGKSKLLRSMATRLSGHWLALLSSARKPCVTYMWSAIHWFRAYVIAMATVLRANTCSLLRMSNGLIESNTGALRTRCSAKRDASSALCASRVSHRRAPSSPRRSRRCPAHRSIS